MKKIVVSLALIFSFSTAHAYNVNDDTTVFGFQKEEYGPKPKSLTFTLLTGAYFRGLNQRFPANISKLNNIWRFGVRIGYAIDENFEVDTSLGYTPTVDNAFNLNVYDYAFNGVYNLIVTPHFVPYGTLGLGGITFVEPLNFRYTRFQTDYGIGVKFFAFPNMAIAPELRAITSFASIHTAFTASLNATYYFTTKHAPKRYDTDRDGVFDDQDQCPNTPLGAHVDIKGCPLDSDGDGVPDYLDKCPNTPAGARVDEKGCPLDSDGDGVPDYLDKCPNTPPNTKVDATGCELADNDLDKDGVLNDKDECPNTPAGARVDAKGCPLDSDGDGVPDYMDRCANTPKGTKVDPEGCEVRGKDSDSDGVVDPKDQCPNTPISVKVDMKGCPLDTDGDGIPDYKDQCITQKEIYNGYKDEDGCPDDELDEFSGVIEGIFFEVNQATIKRESYPKLNRAAEILGKYKILNFAIEGHTDSSGGKAYNMTLSEKRAQSVYEYLRYRGISPERMSVEGYGPTKPIADNKTPAGKAKNRRIEFRILNLDAAKKEAEESKKRAAQ